ncbi:uncharacterized protein Eint_070340 [Encephalitozoon intestinalis ATCC 50506]|uniref:Uncharacterized protein n=1 Tax=Encephalitozoon intestinalis (strain ATCC 50506) TaxID=876142 RepID=E0S7W3_ENCIT|nr:uncharacterized protein Eint_070340 [Encephalitozoon intestinalis ATCC 50506]ADM11798.1 hypothetical protein Eint_070340 [Encephalitozoon intestinalis ATCC 50506]UTX45547.1 hypothetical protein GPK93_07g11100 [Encephalitozoon intestinalis]
MKFTTFKLAACYLYKVAASEKTTSGKEEFAGDSDSNYQNEYLVTRTTMKDTFTPEMTRKMVLENGLAIVRETTTYVNPYEVKFVPGPVLESLDRVAFASERFGASNKFIPKPDFSYMEGYNNMTKKAGNANAKTPESKEGAKGKEKPTTPEDEKASEEAKGGEDSGLEGGQEQAEGENGMEKDNASKSSEKAGFFPSGGSYMRPSFGKYSSLA